MRLLDLCCGEGLAAWGYWLSGRFSEIVGVDTNPEMRTRYSFDFVCGDMLTLDYEFLSGFDFIHASPPCQAYSHVTPKWARGNHMRLVAATHLMLYASGKPYCIENVPGAKKELRPNLCMNGGYFGLPSDRPRFFHVSTLAPGRLLRKPSEVIQVHGGTASKADLIRAFGLEDVNKQRLSHLTMHGIEQGIPPRMTRWIAEAVFPDYRAMVG